MSMSIGVRLYLLFTSRIAGFFHLMEPIDFPQDVTIKSKLTVDSIKQTCLFYEAGKELAKCLLNPLIISINPFIFLPHP